MGELRKGNRKNERFRKRLERHGIDGTYEYHEDAWGAYFTKRILPGGPVVAILPETSDVMPPSVRIDPGLESGLKRDPEGTVPESGGGRGDSGAALREVFMTEVAAGQLT